MTYGIFSTFLYFLKLRNRILRQPYIIPTYMDNICNMVYSVYSLCIFSLSTKEPYLSRKEPYPSTKKPDLSAKEPYLATKMPYFSTKEPYLSTN